MKQLTEIARRELEEVNVKDLSGILNSLIGTGKIEAHSLSITYRKRTTKNRDGIRIINLKKIELQRIKSIQEYNQALLTDLESGRTYNFSCVEVSVPKTETVFDNLYTILIEGLNGELIEIAEEICYNNPNSKFSIPPNIVAARFRFEYHELLIKEENKNKKIVNEGLWIIEGRDDPLFEIIRENLTKE